MASYNEGIKISLALRNEGAVSGPFPLRQCALPTFATNIYIEET